jgi:hypothetical protein
VIIDMVESESNRVDRLAEDNYDYWKFQMKNLLQSKDLWEGVDEEQPGEILRPAAGADQTAYNRRVEERNAWAVKNRKAMNFIAMNVDRANANLIYRANGGREA